MKVLKIVLHLAKMLVSASAPAVAAGLAAGYVQLVEVDQLYLRRAQFCALFSFCPAAAVKPSLLGLEVITIIFIPIILLIYEKLIFVARSVQNLLLPEEAGHSSLVVEQPF